MGARLVSKRGLSQRTAFSLLIIATIIVVIPVLGEKLGIERERQFFEESGIVTTVFADQAIRLYKYLYDYAQFRNQAE